MIHGKRRGALLEAGEGAERNFAVLRRANINISQRLRTDLKIRFHFQHHAVLIQLA